MIQRLVMPRLLCSISMADLCTGVYRWTVRDPAKDHYRIVFKEVCDSLYNINDLSRIFYVLAGACKGTSYHV